MYKIVNKSIQNISTLYPNNMILTAKDKSFYANDLVKNLTKQTKKIPNFSTETLLFGKYSTDHILRIKWDQKKGWSSPIIEPFDYIPIHPFASSLHYAIQCFEGMKVKKNEQGKIRMFRPQCNVMRFKRSSKRIGLPDFDGNELIKCIEEYVRLEEKWIPTQTEFSLYLRPLHISMEQSLGVRMATKSEIFIMCSPVGPYYPSGLSPISLSCSHENIRAFERGTGSYKIGSNYGPTIQPGNQVLKKGYQQILWLNNNQIHEVGASNIFFVFKGSGKKQIVTPTLSDTVLPGVTRDSVLQMLDQNPQYDIQQRKITIDQVIDRLKSGDLLESFGTGTAVVIGSINNIEYMGQDYPIQIDSKLKSGPITYQIRKELIDIQEGRRADSYGWTRIIN